ncbi:NAD+ synthase [Luteimonas sp. e5]
MNAQTPRKLRIAMAQFDFPVGDIDGNRQRIGEMIRDARDEFGADIVLFPELALCGYPPEDLLRRPAFVKECRAALESLAAEVEGIVAVVGWPEQAADGMFNAASVLRDGGIATTARKQVLPTCASVDERRWFTPAGAQAEPCVFEVAGSRVGLIIGEDLDQPAPVTATVAAGARLLLGINASPFEHDCHARRDILLAGRARDNGVGIAWLNLVGAQDALVFDGASLVANADGEVSPAAAAFTDQWLLVEYDPEQGRFAPMEWVDDGDESKYALTWRAIVRGIQDYCGKNGFDRVWLGLSGGLDSALVLALAVHALGADKVTAVRMPSRYTAELSNDLAERQCQALGVELISLPIEAPFRAYLDTLADCFAGREADTTEENLQSRIRGALLMALSNKFGGLVLTTGNKSEYAVGYATIYGDMNGGYAPIKDLYKTEVFSLARWRNTVGGVPANADGVIPPAVIERPPSAELRENQTDQDSLPPYDVLDGILRRHIEEQQSRDEIVAAGFDVAVVERVLQLVQRSEWKRQQAAPGPRLSRRGFGRERRYPSTNAWRG